MATGKTAAGDALAPTATFSGFPSRRHTSRGLLRRGSQSGGSKGAGFTLIELLIVMAILMSLAALFYAVVGGATTRAKTRATKALIRRLSLDIEAYKRKTGRYPPDGIDSEVANEAGDALRGAAALYQALTKPIIVETMVGGVPRTVQYEAIAEYEGSTRTEEHPDYPGIVEFRDAFGTPLHYDNTEDGSFRPQGGEVHYPPLDDADHPADPRTLDAAESADGVQAPNENMSDGFDLWSHAVRAHDVDEPAVAPIATWNLRED